MQRIFDIFFSSVALIILLPFLLPMMFLLKVTGEGEIFFLQNRVGREGKYFKLYKFSTMLKNSPNLTTGTLTLKNDPRILPVGRFIRSTKINELPQLINIFIGNMSVIGPRPQTPRCFDAFSLSAQNRIKQVRPGLSGIGSIIFRREEDLMHANSDPDKFYDEIVMPYKGSLEDWYVSNQSIGTYFSLIGLTVWVLLSSNTGLVWAVYKDLPEPPAELKLALSYPH